MIAEIEFPYNKKFNPVEQGILQTLTSTQLKWDTAKEGELDKMLDWNCRLHVMAIEDALRFGEVTVKRIITGGICSKLNQIVEHLKTLNPQPPLNTRVEVSVPGNGLLNINKVQMEKDCCTDRVAELLGEGWRIVAVCPQPDQRRPDYIFGRYEREQR